MRHLTSSIVLVLLIAACNKDEGGNDGNDPPDDSDTESADTGVDTDDTDDTDDPPQTAHTGASGDTGTPALTCVDHEEHVANRGLGAAWFDADGQGIALSGVGSAVRSVDGTWTDDSDIQRSVGPHMDASSMDEVWAASNEGLWRRDPVSGTWAEQPMPYNPGDVEGVFVGGPNDLTLLIEENEYYAPSRVTLAHFDGTDWTSEDRPSPYSVEKAAQLSDGRLLIVYDGSVYVDNGVAFVAVPGTSPPTSWSRGDLSVGSDDTVLFVDHDVFVGTEAGLVEVDPGRAATTWYYGTACAADDLWVFGFDDKTYDPVMRHFDRGAWSDVVLPTDRGLTFPVHCIDDGVVIPSIALDGRLVLSGDPSGLVVEVDEIAPFNVDTIMADDVTGSFYGFGVYDVSTFDGTTWTRVELPLPTGAVHTYGAASGGEIVVWDWESLWHWDGTTATETAFPFEILPYVVVGVDGSFYAFGEERLYDGPRIGNVGFRYDSGAWVPLDLTSLSDDAEIDSAWADGVDDVYLGIKTPGGGGLAHWDGTAVTVLDNSLEAAPSWMARQSDGLLWLNGGAGLHTWDGATMSQVPDVPFPSVRWAHVFSDGTVHVSVMEEVKVGDDEELRGRVYRQSSGGWEQVVDDPHLVSLAGYEDLVVASRAYGAVAWWSTCE